MYPKGHVRKKDGKKHVYYSICESTRLLPKRWPSTATAPTIVAIAGKWSWPWSSHPKACPLTYELFVGNITDVATLQANIEEVEQSYGKMNRIWVFDRGIVSEENLALPNERYIGYLVGTPGIA